MCCLFHCCPAAVKLLEHSGAAVLINGQTLTYSVHKVLLDNFTANLLVCFCHLFLLPSHTLNATIAIMSNNTTICIFSYHIKDIGAVVLSDFCCRNSL